MSRRTGGRGGDPAVLTALVSARHYVRPPLPQPYSSLLTNAQNPPATEWSIMVLRSIEFAPVVRSVGESLLGGDSDAEGSEEEVLGDSDIDGSPRGRFPGA